MARFAFPPRSGGVPILPRTERFKRQAYLLSAVAAASTVPPDRQPPPAPRSTHNRHRVLTATGLLTATGVTLTASGINRHRVSINRQWRFTRHRGMGSATRQRGANRHGANANRHRGAPRRYPPPGSLTATGSGSAPATGSGLATPARDCAKDLIAAWCCGGAQTSSRTKPAACFRCLSRCLRSTAVIWRPFVAGCCVIVLWLGWPFRRPIARQKPLQDALRDWVRTPRGAAMVWHLPLPHRVGRSV